MKKLVLLLATAAAVLAAALIPAGPPVAAAGPGFGSAVSAVNQNSWQTNGSVNAVAIAGNNVYIGGLFTRVRPAGKPAGQGEAVRPYLAMFSRTTGNATSFAPVLNGAVWSIAISLDGNWVVVGGDFTTVNGQTRNRIAMFSTATGALSTFKPSVAYRVKAVAIYGNSVFFGGSFGTVNGVIRNRLAAVALDTGKLLPWNPNADDDVYAIDVADNGTKVFAGGPFTKIGGASHYSLVALNNSTGAALPFAAASAIPTPTITCTTRVKDIDTNGANVYVANGGDGAGCYDGTLAANISTGQLIWQNKCLGATEAIKSIGSYLYKGSHAHDCSSSPGGFPNGTGTHYLLVQSATTGNLGPWFPNTDAGGTTKVGPLAMAASATGTDLWVGGDFSNVNGVAQQGITRFTNAVGGAKPATPAAPVASSTVANRVGVSFKNVVDLDNITLTYKLFRGTTLIGTWNSNSYPWVAAKTITATDTGVTSGQSVNYRVEVLDGYNTIWSAYSATVKVR
jgi:hypothetical protein